MKNYYRCRSNPSAPLLVLDSEWEAKEMRQNLEYDHVDEDGLPVVDAEEPVAEEKDFIPFAAGVKR